MTGSPGLARGVGEGKNIAGGEAAGAKAYRREAAWCPGAIRSFCRGRGLGLGRSRERTGR